MALSTVQTEIVDASSPVHDQYSLGSRMRYLDTAGQFTGTLDYGAEKYNMTEATVLADSTDFTDTTGSCINPYGFYIVDDTTAGSVRISTATPALGDHLVVVNMATGTTFFVCFSTGGTVTFHNTGDCYVEIEPGEVVNAVAVSTAQYISLFGSGSYLSAFASST